MAKCDYCGSSIIFGGTKNGDLTFCNEKCEASGYVLSVASHIPDEVVAERALEIHQGQCPKCQGAGPVDVHTSHWIWSLLLLTSWRSEPDVCCKGCDVKKKIGAMLFSGLCGWWGFPWGIVITPIQLGRNFFGVFGGPDPSQPSDQLRTMAMTDLAIAFLEKQEAEEGQP